MLHGDSKLDLGEAMRWDVMVLVPICVFTCSITATEVGIRQHVGRFSCISGLLGGLALSCFAGTGRYQDLRLEK